MSFHYIELKRRYPEICKNNDAVNCSTDWMQIIDALCENLQQPRCLFCSDCCCSCLHRDLSLTVP